MSQLPIEAIKDSFDRYQTLVDIQFQYGTAGFRTEGDKLDSVIFRVGILAALRSKKLDGKFVGVMVTASHNPEKDNGVKIVDAKGEMLEASWEAHATILANAPNADDFINTLQIIAGTAKIDLSKPSRVVYARDTRGSGSRLVSALEEGLRVMNVIQRNIGITTTPILHYTVNTINTKNTPENYDFENEYYKRLSDAFKTLVSGRPSIGDLRVDCANGVGAMAASELLKHLGGTLQLNLVNEDYRTPGKLNSNCGADYVKTTQQLPPTLDNILAPGQRGCSLDGDADRLIYYYLDNRHQFHMLDGDKITALVAAFISELVKSAGLESQVKVGVVQTAYANGASTKYLAERLPVKCVPTGVKHLHHAAEHYNIGVYFEANGHGTVLFSQSTQEKLAQHQPSTPAQQTALDHLKNLTQLINQTVGDALSDILLVEVVLAHKSYTAAEWDSLYVDLPNRLVKVVVGDRNAFRTENAERRLVSPPGLQSKIDELVRRYEGGRSFVRPSGTEDVVRVYAEAVKKPEADDLAFRVAGLVYDEAGGDPGKCPKEFIL